MSYLKSGGPNVIIFSEAKSLGNDTFTFQTVVFVIFCSDKLGTLPLK